MNLGELRSRLRTWTDKPAAILTDTACDDCVRATLERMVNAHDWQGQGKSVTLSYASDTDGVELPEDFISEKHVSQVAPGQSDPSARLSPIPKLMGGRQAWLDSFNAATTNPRSPLPRGGTTGVHYYLWDEKLYIVPNPSGAMDVVLDYIEALAVLPTDPLASNVLTRRYGHTAVAWGALREAYLFLHMWTAAERAEAVYQGMLDGALKRDLSTRLSGPKPQRGP